ncbi:D-amino acid dehydrogenase [Sneathiella chinensis]|uniref:D-amino-acid dehydrogenase n=1 Tax=Sneathiella chinensis TaxID=349750 RepID=A0ABQ5U4B4_9PROT|nr:D-amino acid dehydrogenase [Sneathiella chinensis]GLQ07007.1 D-amino-acid dehydrogenase [Sneathiella chinensis]
MKIAVIGAGVTGVTTAYSLARRGQDVTVFDRQPGPAEETSFANGGQISVSQPFPWSTPRLPGQLVRWLGRKDAPLVLKLQKDPFMWHWAIRFLWSGRRRPFYDHAEKILKLALHSKTCLNDMVAREDIDYSRQNRGILKLFTGEKAEQEATERRDWLRTFGVEQALLSREECIRIEPALTGSASGFTGGTFSPIDESGDARHFTQALAATAERMGVAFQYDCTITGLEKTATDITGLSANGQFHAFDKVILCGGAYSRHLAKECGLSLPVYPVKGYSVSIPVEGTNIAPLTSITDETNHVVISRLGDRLRAAGTAEINGYNRTANPVREDLVLNSVMKLFPDCGDPDRAERWCGLRPMTPDCVPLIGKTRLGNLYTNTGHGALGWTLSAGSADLVTALVLNETPPLAPEDYSSFRF